MPNYDLHCDPCDLTFEHFMFLQEHEASGGRAPCPQCGAPAEQVILPRRNRAGYAYLDEVTYFENPNTKEVILAAASHREPPPGFVKKSTGLINEQRQLVKRLNDQDRSKFSEAQALEQRFLADELSRQHSEMRDAMQGWDDVYKDMARIAMENNNRGGGHWDKSGQGRDFGYLEILE